VDLTSVVERLARIPDRYRRCTVSRSRAWRAYRVPDELLADLLDAGMPHEDGADGPTFDREDLKTVVLMLGLPSPKRAALVAMARALAAGAAAPRVRRTVTVRAYCPGRGHPGACRFAVAPALGATPVGDPPDQAFAREVLLRGGEFRFALSAAERQLLAEAARLRFHHVPYELNQDLGFLAETGLADCTLANRFLTVRGRELGVAVREATGLFLSRPFADRHFWIELRRGDEWLPADPFFLTALVRWGVLDERSWPAHRSPLGAYWKLPLGPMEQVVTHRGAAAPPGGRAEDPQRLGPAQLFVR
jgi:hypothetical protein